MGLWLAVGSEPRADTQAAVAVGRCPERGAQDHTLAALRRLSQDESGSTGPGHVLFGQGIPQGSGHLLGVVVTTGLLTEVGVGEACR